MQMINSLDDTIAAIATPPGPGGIGIIRISGDEALGILKRIFRPRKGELGELASHKMYYGWIADPHGDLLLDEVLAVFMANPHSYTREDVVEIHCHGSFLVQQEILTLATSLGARPAEPGEFTKRAFLNGRIDLTQAEAVLDVLQAKTKAGLQLAMGQLHGQLQGDLDEIRQALLEVLALIEVAIDFPEDDVEILDSGMLLATLIDRVEKPLRHLLQAADQGKVYREGITVVILGRPNVGKSSMLNRLLREERAIVTAVPGTTRDTIEEYINMLGMPVRLVDTAGIRETAESVEEIGIQRARQKLEEADLLLFMVDGSMVPQEEDRSLYATLKSRPHLLVLNKSDIGLPGAANIYAEAFPESQLVALSTKTGEGLAELEQAVFARVTAGQHWDPGHVSVPNVRHRKILMRALEGVVAAVDGLGRGEPADLVCVDVQAVLGHLGEVVGESTPDDVLDIIFEKFCIGK